MNTPLYKLIRREVAFKNEDVINTLIHSSRPKFFNIPVECVVDTPQIVTPDQGRAHPSIWYYDDKSNTHDNLILTYEQLAKRSDFRGTSYFKRIYLMEIWSDGGDDGHTDYFLCGYAFVFERDVQDIKRWDISQCEFYRKVFGY